MKRWLALLLALIVPFTSISGTIAETLRLPKNLKHIEQEAFSAAASAEEVDVPFGTETIGSQAFARSGLKKIYLPSTVYDIAEDAFSAEDITIVTPDGTYAKAFADEHGFAWEDGSAHYKQDTLQAAKDYWESDEEHSLVLESTEIALISTDGITDEAQLAAISQINQSLLAYEELAKEYEDSLASLTDALESLADEVTSVGIDQQDDQLALSLGSAVYTFSGDAMGSLGSDYEIVSSEQTQDGSGVITEVTSGGKTYYMISSATGTVVSSTKEAANLRQARIVARGGTAEALIEAVQEFLSRLQILIAPIDDIIDTALDDAQRLADQAFNSLMLLLDSQEQPYVSLHTLKQAERRYEAAKAILDGVKRAQYIWRSLSITGSVSGIISDVQNFRKLSAIAAHGHPIPEISADDRRMNAIQLMNDHILSAKWMYACDAALNFLDLLGSVACAINTIAMFTPMGGIVASVQALSKLTSVALTMLVAQIVSSAKADAELELVQKVDNQLHSFVHGHITDEETEEPIANVGVTNDSVAVISDQNGYYKIYLFPEENHSLTFRVDRYEDNGFVASLSPWEELERDIELKHKEDGATVFGTVTSKDGGEALQGVQVTCGDLTTTTGPDGSYRLEQIEPGSYDISFYKSGYTRWSENFTLEEYQEFELNVSLDDCYIITTREELEAVANDVMGNYTLGNSISLGGEPWTPLPWFSGTFDGAGYSIDGLQIEEDVDGYAGLFVGLYGGEIYDLNMSGVDIELEVSAGFAGIGAICGGLNNGSSLTDCQVSGKITTTSANSNRDVFVGGLAGFSDSGYITDCFSGVDLSVTTDNTAHAGGLAGILNGGQAKNSYADCDVSVVQSGTNSGANLKAFGTLYSAASLADSCSADGSVTVHSTNGSASACGVARSKNSVNLADVSASTDHGSATAIGYMEGENGANSGAILATCSTATKADVAAYGLSYVSNGENRGSVTARAVAGSALAVGCQDSGSNVTNSGAVTAESTTGTANASGLRGQGNSSVQCLNTGAVNATGGSGALAGGVYGCASSLNTGNVTVVADHTSAVGQGMTNCSDSTNSGKVDVTFKGTDNVKGSLSAHGLSNCSNSTNAGTVTGTVEASTTACTVTGVSGGSGNINNGSVTATSESGPANARGVYSSSSQNYGFIYAYTSADTNDSNSNATAYGVNASSSKVFNGGQVTAVSENAAAHAYGTSSGRNSTGEVSATSHYFVTGTDENGVDWGEVGIATAQNSTSVQATVAGHSVSASGGATVKLYYFFAASNCRYHRGMSRQFVSFQQGSEPEHFDNCYLLCGTADSDAE